MKIFDEMYSDLEEAVRVLAKQSRYIQTIYLNNKCTKNNILLFVTFNTGLVHSMLENFALIKVLYDERGNKVDSKYDNEHMQTSVKSN